MAEHDHGQIIITLHNEDNGQENPLSGGPGTPVRTLTTHLYNQILKRERRPDDRLRCEESGQDVFQYEDMHLRDYVEQHCRHRRWLFAGGVGGA